MNKFILEIPLGRNISDLIGLFIEKPSFGYRFSNDYVDCIFWGDPIIPNAFNERFNEKLSVNFIIENVCGHYYFILLNKSDRKIIVGNSLFGILPIYFYCDKDKLILSENVLNLSKHIGMNKLSRRFVMEIVLFNYPLFNQSLFEEIDLLPSNSFITIANSKWEIIKHTHISDYFSFQPLPWRKAVNDMRDNFLSNIEKYLPDQPYINSLTGGFDGRTLTAAGLFHKKKFTCYSFGSCCSKDVEIASSLAAKANIPFIKVDLDDEYAKNSSLDCGLEFIRNASGTATFARAHYLYAAKLLAAKTEHIVTGNFGSEIFRAAHVPGVVIAPNLYNLFNASSPGEAFLAIEASDEFDYLNKANFKKEWEELKDDMSQIPCFDPGYKSLTRNQKFYVFVFEEVFRKYFGAEMVNQFGYLKNRTPFLDFDFMKAIFKTGLAGIHSDYFEHNPVKRYKGQVLYAHIIKKAYPPFGRMMTDKGYRPNDLLSVSGKLRIVQGYAKKMLNRNISASDPYGVAMAYSKNHKYFSRIPIDPELFNSERIGNEVLNKPKEGLFKPLSLSYLWAQIKK
ncbi:MAG: hypothetical protein L6428_04570 [Candidatus Aminicenantes bacterium]|nr:hypothetical protein [Candidatus Aminicenantes bacterium]